MVDVSICYIVAAQIYIYIIVGADIKVMLIEHRAVSVKEVRFVDKIVL